MILVPTTEYVIGINILAVYGTENHHCLKRYVPQQGQIQA